MLLSTPYYRTLIPTNLLGCDDESDFNYGPYDLFCMQTRLYPTVYSLFGRDIIINFKGIHEDNRMAIKVNLVKIPDIITDPIPNEEVGVGIDVGVGMTDTQRLVLQTAISKIVTENSKYSLIDRNELYIVSGRRYPQTWFNNVLGYVPLTSSYNPFIRPEGIYLTFNPVADFKTAYNNTVGLLLDSIDQYYKDGVVYGASNIAISWKLERLDNETIKAKLFRPTWQDRRFAPNLVEFLLMKITGDPYIRIKISDNMVQRHRISEHLSTEGVTIVFDGSYVKIPVGDLDDAQYLASVVTESQCGGNSEGKGGNNGGGTQVITYTTNQISMVYLYIDAANKLLNNPSCTGYKTSDPEKPFTFSCIVNRDKSISTVLGELETMVWTHISLGTKANKVGDGSNNNTDTNNINNNNNNSIY